MRQFIIFLLTMVALVVIGYYIYEESKFQQIQVNNNYFHIEKDKDIYDKNNSLQTLVDLRRRLDTLINYLSRKYPQNAFIQRMKIRFKGTVLREIGPNGTDPKQTSYTINKGDRMVLCLRTTDGQLVDINTLTYVAIHELAHIYSSSLHHNAEFWENMRFLVDEAVEAGLYQKVNYFQNPVRYCGIYIKSNVAINNRHNLLFNQS